MTQQKFGSPSDTSAVASQPVRVIPIADVSQLVIRRQTSSDIGLVSLNITVSLNRRPGHYQMSDVSAVCDSLKRICVCVDMLYSPRFIDTLRCIRHHF